MTQTHGRMIFEPVDVTLLRAPSDVLKTHKWSLQVYNAPYLAGKAGQPFQGITELGTKPEPKLSDNWSGDDTTLVVGDISDTLAGSPDVILAQTSNFKRFGELAGMMGYRPIKAGEFLQIMDWLAEGKHDGRGYYYCYEGRQSGYAIVATYSRDWKLEFEFDTHIGNQIEEEYLGANLETNCIFVRT